MEMRGFWELGHVSNEQLRRDLAGLLAGGYRTEARIIAHLAEFESRRLYAKDGSEALFPYCTKRLGLSNSEAFNRITVARLARKYPLIFELIERRDLHLTAVCLLRDYLTTENHRELLAEAAHKTKWQVEELIARRFPSPDVVSRVRKLPTPSADRRVVPPSIAELVCSGSSLPVPVPASVPASVSVSATPVATGAPRTSAETRPLIAPTSEARYRIQLNASASLKEKLDLARGLVSHSNPGGDIAVVIERALDALIEKVQRQRFAKTDRPRRSRREPRSAFVQTKCRSPEPERNARPRRMGPSIDGATAQSAERRREHIPNAIRRAIVERDGLRCTFVSDGGCRCEAYALLQIHHDKPWAIGGRPELENLRLLCATHNRLLAEQDFGTKLIAQRIAARRTPDAKPEIVSE